jgi:hypothetical protein
MTMDLRTPSKLECEGGDFVLDPELLAARFSLDVERFRRLLRAGLVKSTVEKGRDEDEGRRRLTVRCGNRAWTAVVDENGHVLGENLVVLRHVPPRRVRSSA